MSSLIQWELTFKSVTWLWKRNENSNVVDREEPGLAGHGTLEPRVDIVEQFPHEIRIKSQFSFY